MILLAGFLTRTSVLLITEGDPEALGGVYTLSFLAVMALFGLGNVLLKVGRSRMPRPVVASWLAVIIAIGAVVAGWIGNAIKNPEYFWVFVQYFVPAMAVVVVMLGRIAILRVCLAVVRTISTRVREFLNRIIQLIVKKIDEINSQQMVFFTRGDNIASLNAAMQYVQTNEHTGRIKFVTVAETADDVPAKLQEEIQFLDEAYPEIDIEFVVIEGTFGPDLIHELSEKWDIPTNLMFIGSHSGRFRFDQADLGGVRLII